MHPGRRVFLGIIFGVVWCSACSHGIALVNRSQRKVTYKEVANNFYVWGLVGKGKVDIYKTCEGAPSYKVIDTMKGIDVFIAVLTLGFAEPRTVKITCGARADERKSTKLSFFKSKP